MGGVKGTNKSLGLVRGAGWQMGGVKGTNESPGHVRGAGWQMEDFYKHVSTVWLPHFSRPFTSPIPHSY